MQPVDNYLRHSTNGDKYKSSYGGGGAIGGGIADLKSGYGGGGAPKGKMRAGGHVRCPKTANDDCQNPSIRPTR